ncbi:MAG: hypothetical protein ED556_12200 [Winogradskyella sp.]|nr:MAG: hypothetical protein ED556_12200 [Winogradskyella sp.]
MSLLTSCESEENTFNREFITFTINDDYTYTLEVTQTQNDSCDLLLSINNDLTVVNNNCSFDDNSLIDFRITNFEPAQDIDIQLNGSFAGGELEAILGFRIPYEGSQGIINPTLFMMVNGSLNVLNSGSVNEFIDFEFNGEALAPTFSSELFSVSCTAHILRDE